MMINKCFDARKFMINFFISVANNIKVSLWILLNTFYQ
jgi:hypothetical protein